MWNKTECTSNITGAITIISRAHLIQCVTLFITPVSCVCVCVCVYVCVMCVLSLWPLCVFLLSLALCGWRGPYAEYHSCLWSVRHRGILQAKTHTYLSSLHRLGFCSLSSINQKTVNCADYTILLVLSTSSVNWGHQHVANFHWSCQALLEYTFIFICPLSLNINNNINICY